MMKVDVRIFGPLHDVVRSDHLVLDVPSPGTGEAAFETLAASFPALRRWKSSVRLAVNLEYVPFDTSLHAGDEISFIPPVSGG